MKQYLFKYAPMILAQMLQEYLTANELGLRETAREIGCNHTTLLRFIKGKPVEDRPLALIMAWALSDPKASTTKKKN